MDDDQESDVAISSAINVNGWNFSYSEDNISEL